MRVLADRRRNTSRRRMAENSHHTEAAVATIWLVFYVLAIGVAITSPMLTRAIELATR